MNHKSIEKHIDNKIKGKLSSGALKLNSMKSELIDTIIKFSSRESYIETSKFDLLRNWKKKAVKEKYTTYYVIHSIKRLKDIDWLIENKNNFPNHFSDAKLFNLILFKESIK